MGPEGFGGVGELIERGIEGVFDGVGLGKGVVDKVLIGMNGGGIDFIGEGEWIQRRSHRCLCYGAPYHQISQKIERVES